MPPADLAPWVSAGLAIGFDTARPAPPVARFPALVGSTLTMVAEGWMARSAGGDVQPLPPSFLAGPATAPVLAHCSPRLRCVGLSLTPAATQSLIGGGAVAVTNNAVAAKDLFGPSWAGWEERIRSARCPEEQIRLLFAFARSRLDAPLHRSRGERLLRLQRVACHDLGAAPRELGLSARHFERTFAQSLGMRPKLFQRVARVELTLREAMVSGRCDADLALRHGWYDQSHMARDFRQLAAAPPRQLVAAAQDACSEHWPLQAGTRTARSA